jgi:ABC-type phosphate/phosphonate transport system substrate-binding protein
MPINFQLGYYPWITQHLEPAKIRSAVELFASAFEKELQQDLPGATVVVTNPVDVAQQVERIISHERVIEFMNPLGFVLGRLKSQKLEAVAVAQRIIDGELGVNYFAQLYTHVASGLTSIDQAVQKVQKSVGYGVPFSTSNFLIPALELQKRRIHPFLNFKAVEFLGGHPEVAKAVYEQKIVLGAGHDGVITDLSRQKGFEDAESKLKTLVRSPPIPSDPIIVNIPDDTERKAVVAALVRASGSVDGKRALAEFWGNAQGLEPTSSQRYDVIKDAIDELRVRPEELLPKS